MQLIDKAIKLPLWGGKKNITTKLHFYMMAKYVYIIAVVSLWTKTT